MNYTQNYKLNQWEASDRVLRTDFNADNAKIDAALVELERGKAEASVVSALQTAVAGKGNCNILMGSYTGTGTTDFVTLDFGVKAKMVLVVGGQEHTLLAYGIETASSAYNSNGRILSVKWTETGVSWRSTNGTEYEASLNMAGSKYCYIVLY